jgi:two-component system OmpR family sensor kinase
MARHFLGLYLLIVLTLAAVSWGQDKLLQVYGSHTGGADRLPAAALYALAAHLEGVPEDARKPVLADIAAKTGADIELFARADITGRQTLDDLRRGNITFMQGSAGEFWALKQLADGSVLAFKYADPEAGDPQIKPLEWTVTLVFYASIALVIMVGIWPLRRDLRALESAASRFGNRNWAFDANIKPRSQIFALAETFRKMAERIDRLIASHKDMSNAVSHEIRTPLARMQFEIESAQRAEDLAQVRVALDHIKADAAAINGLVSATLNYAILERADVSLNIGRHDFCTLVPAIAEHVTRDARPEIRVQAEVHGEAREVVCDLHLIESAFKNLLYNAARHATHDVRVAFDVRDGVNRLVVDDDGPGIPEKDRRRVFESFVQLENPAGPKTGFGLGLAIVKRALEWHGGEVTISDSPLGGARFCATWPAMSASSLRC